MNSRIDYALYVITDSRLARGRSHLDVIRAALQGGSTIVQYREKNATTRTMIEEGLPLLDLCHAHRVPLIVNDRIDVALAIGADGVHVGDDDMPVALARKLMGTTKIVGASADSLDKAHSAIAAGADYVGVGAVFATGSKADAGAPIGLEGLSRVAAASRVPVVGIGGIGAQNAASVIHAGAAGIAVISAVVHAEDVEKAARELRHIVDQAKQDSKRSV